MGINTVAIVLGVLPKNNQLPGQVIACLDEAIKLLKLGSVQAIVAIGGYGHGSRGQLKPEAQMMKEYLGSKGVEPKCIVTNDIPVTTPEVIWELRHMGFQFGYLLTVREKQERIALFVNRIVGGKVDITVHAVQYVLTPDERQANRHEAHLLREAKEELRGMRFGDEAAFRRLYSFEHHLWVSFVERLRSEGRLEAFLAEL